jgi:hypothetical protein
MIVQLIEKTGIDLRTRHDFAPLAIGLASRPATPARRDLRCARLRALRRHRSRCINNGTDSD